MSDLRHQKVCGHCGLTFAKDSRNTWAYWAKAKFCNMADAMVRGRIRAGKKAKLTAAQVRAIRNAPSTYKEIANAYGVTRSTVSLIIARKTWRHLP